MQSQEEESEESSRARKGSRDRGKEKFSQVSVVSATLGKIWWPHSSNFSFHLHVNTFLLGPLLPVKGKHTSGPNQYLQAFASFKD